MFRIIGPTEIAFTITQGEEFMSNVDIVLCEDCGNSLQNDMSDDYCNFNA